MDDGKLAVAGGQYWRRVKVYVVVGQCWRRGMVQVVDMLKKMVIGEEGPVVVLPVGP